ncbi:MAG: VCBS repeat-containing protein [Deltaproteobacteria bacterium]|nr:VCBS repeat-containing protein [Deltaproteobacteria bacterium]
MSNQSSISRFRPSFIPLLTFFASLLLLIFIGPGSTQGFAAQVKLAWDTDPGATGYKLYYGYASRTYGTPVDVGNVTQYTLTGIQEGANCYFAVTAYDTNRNESAFSIELPCVTLIPAPCVNGSISPSSAVVDSLGMSQTFTITPSANYKISAVTVDGVSVGAVSSYTFSNVTTNHTIAPSFALISNTYAISASAGANGSISPSGSVSVSQGASQAFTITANTGYQIQNVLVDGTSVGAVTSYTFSNVTAAHTISASFAPKTYAINASAGANGSISPSGSVSVTQGASQAFTITANTGYQVQSVLVDGVSVGAVTSYTFSNVTAAHTISATFAAKTYAISASAGANGTISPSGSVSVTQGASQAITITANTGYQVQSVLVDGVSVGAVTSYTFSNVTANHSISVSFISPALLELNFEEGSGSTAKDSSGSGNNGSISGAAYTADSAVGSYALSFSGKGLVTVPAKSSLMPSNLSVAFWVKHTTDTSSSYGGIIQGAYGNGYSKGFRLLDYQNKPLGQINFGDAGPVWILGKAFVLGQWTHMVLTYDHQKISLYQNGVLVNAISETRNINWNTSASNLTIGLAQWYFKGLIDDVLMYNRALSSQEVGQLYAEKGTVSVATTSPNTVLSSRVSSNTVPSARTNYSVSAPFKKRSTTQNLSKQNTDTTSSHLLAGSGVLPGSGGWIEVLTPQGGEAALPVHVDWPEYNQLNGEMRVATGDIVGDGRDRIIVGLGRVKDAPGIPGGYFAVLDSDYSVLAWGQVEWPEYNEINGETRPACGDIDGDGIAEIIVGLGPGGEGRMEVFKYVDHQLKHVKWLQAGWQDYNRGNGEMRPACGDLNGDGKVEVIAGLGPIDGNPDIPGGVFFIFDQTSTGSTDLRDSSESDASGWGVINWPEYNRLNGESWPACGDVNGDGKDEIVLSLGKQGEGRFEILGFDMLQNRTQHIAWQQSLLSEGSTTHPACGRLETDAGDEIVIGFSRGGVGFMEVFGNADQKFQPLRQVQTQFEAFQKQESEIWPAVFRLKNQ